MWFLMGSPFFFLSSIIHHTGGQHFGQRYIVNEYQYFDSRPRRSLQVAGDVVRVDAIGVGPTAEAREKLAAHGRAIGVVVLCTSKYKPHLYQYRVFLTWVPKYLGKEAALLGAGNQSYLAHAVEGLRTAKLSVIIDV